MSRVSRLLAAAVAMVVLTACGGASTGGAAGDYPADDLSIMAPADPGGGWDSTARAMQQVLTEGGVIDSDVEVYNVGGAGGTIGLAEFVNDHAGDPYQLMVMGLVMVGAIRTNDSPVDLTEVTPVAALTTEYEAVVVPTDSEYEDMQQLVEDLKADPGAISWGGGSAGGTDHILVGQIAEAVGADPSQINYVAHAGGGEALAAVLSGGVTAGVSGVSEFADQVEAGKLRFLGVSSEEPIEGIDSPTLQDAGVDVVLENWRGVVAPPDIPEEDVEGIIAMLDEMHASPEWEQALETNGWTDFYMTGEEFRSYLEEQTTETEQVLAGIGLIE